MPSRDMLRIVARDFGPRVIGWTCNMSEEQTRMLLSDELRLEEPQRTVFERLIGSLFSLRLQAAVEGFPLAMLISHLGQSTGHVDHNVLNVWREEAGGELPQVVVEDTVLNPLQHLALDAYPTLLMLPYLARRHGVEPTLMHSSFAFNHSARPQFEAAVLEDEALALLFPTRGENAMSTYSYITASTGRGGTLQLVGLASQAIQSAYIVTRMRGGIEIDDLFKSLRDIVQILRRIATGQQVDVPTFVGFNNISLDINSAIPLPWGTLKPYADTYSEFVPSEAGPSHFNDEGQDVSLGFVLETSYPYQVLVAPWEPGPPSEESPPWPSGMAGYRKELEYNCRLTSLTFSLAIERDPPVAAAVGWMLLLDPLSQGTGASWNSRAYPPLDFYRIKQDNVRSISDWAAIVASVDDSKIRIAQRRILSALAERRDPVDGLIDAVIAWENLFGAGQGELSFRISAAMASLLSKAADKRLQVQAEIARLYSRRSKVLHGDVDLSPEDATRDRNRALSLILAALRELYRDQPHLLTTRDRARILILSPPE
jgi:hypothetical protein